MSGPLDPDVVTRSWRDYSPSAARLILELLVERGTVTKLDADTFAAILARAKVDKPDWEPRTAEKIQSDRLEALGVKIPEPRPDPKVEEREEIVIDEDEPEREL